MPAPQLRNSLLRSNLIEPRSYQETIANTALRRNTLVCLPTGLGKSVIAAYVAAVKLALLPTKGVIMLAPTKPLVLQHYRTFRNLIELDDASLVCLTGEVGPDERQELWTKRFIFSTPQILMNDLITGRVLLDTFSLLIFDEAHRAVGDYPYVFIAEQYSKVEKGLILGLTASPGSSEGDVREICRNLHLDWVEARTSKSDDVKPYVGAIDVNWVSVELPKIFYDVKSKLEDFLREMLRVIKDQGFLASAGTDRVRLRDVLDARQRILEEAANGRKEAKSFLTQTYAAIHAIRAIELLETQGFPALQSQLNDLADRAKARASPGVRLILADKRILEVIGIVNDVVAKEADHPKVTELIRRVRSALGSGARRVMVFTNYRTTAARLTELLNKVDGVSAVRLVGQASKEHDKGLTQKKQSLILDDFRSGSYNVLVATQIGEEGLDIVECDEVIFYDTVPSAIRYIQRRGRTGRNGPGKAVILIAKGTRDEAYYWISRRREREMGTAIRQFMKNQSNESPDQLKIEKYMSEKSNVQAQNEIVIVADSRELGAVTTRELVRLGGHVKSESLAVGDFILSDRAVVERKEIEDFVSSIIDGRLFDQAIKLKTYERPIIIVEGENPLGSGRVGPEALLGAYASVLIDYGIPILWSPTPTYSAQLMLTIARREQTQEKRAPRIMSVPKPPTIEEQQEFIVASLPSVDRVRARSLLTALGTVERIFSASKEELKSVNGIGEKISDDIRRVLTSKYVSKDKK
ncbi:MAG TPA: DEAD/DEAH box helicase [Methylomirabilota bacterium]|nr:DEAD/DEAH box helicase [Methylomirabilota bacterium]